jgi:hypothetical protein
MTNKTSKRFVARDILPRLVIAFCLFIGLTAVWIWQPLIKQTPTRFLVQIPREPPEQQTVTEDRDLSAYERGADFSNCTYGSLYGSNQNIQQCENARNKGRSFIWNHWKSKKRGYIVYVVTGYHGETDFHIFIEPDKNGTWHIVRRWRKDTPYMKLNAYYEVPSTDSIFIKRKRAITEDDIERLGKFYLSFLDNDGNEADTL